MRDISYQRELDCEREVEDTGTGEVCLHAEGEDLFCAGEDLGVVFFGSQLD